jgi:hypothetical protein
VSEAHAFPGGMTRLCLRDEPAYVAELRTLRVLHGCVCGRDDSHVALLSRVGSVVAGLDRNLVGVQVVLGDPLRTFKLLCRPRS